MLQHLHIFYVFLTLASGVVSLTLLALAYSQTKERSLECWLAFYTTFTLLVGANVVLFYMEANIQWASSYLFISFGYFESLILGYIVIFTLPVFLHELCGTTGAIRRNRLIGGLALTSSLVEHAAIFLFPQPSFSVFQNMFENTVMLGVLTYSSWLCFSSWKHLREVSRQNLSRQLGFLLIFFLPGLFNDTFLDDLSSIRFFPLLYCGLSIVFARHIMKYYLSHASRQTASEPNDRFFALYNISPREQEVVPLILQGSSNQQIADTLFISPNTVKTHVRNIYAKLGVKNRVEFLTFMRDMHTPSSDGSSKTS
jgi:DNA-binding CsgD family transcriptional regulator